MTTARFYYKNNRLQQLRGFYNVVKFKSFTKAAEKMGLVQSAISLQIKHLQDDLGVKLLETKDGKITLTEKGEKFYEKVFPIVEQTDNLFKEFWGSMEKESANELKLAMHHVAASYIFPKAFAQILREYPDTKLKLSSISKSEAIERLLKDELEMAVYPCSIYEEFPPEIKATSFMEYKICILVPKEHELANIKDEEITLDKIMNHKLLYEDERLMTSSKIIGTFKENSLRSEIEFENANWEIISNACREGIGIAGFDEIYCKNIKNENMAIKSIAHFLPKMSYMFLTKKNAEDKERVTILTSFVCDH